jgi:hypothetical protein
MSGIFSFLPKRKREEERHVSFGKQKKSIASGRPGVH